MVTGNELKNFLGADAETLRHRLGTDGWDRLIDTVSAIKTQYPPTQDEQAPVDERYLALTGAIKVAGGSSTLSELAQVRRDALRQAREAMITLSGAIMWMEHNGVTRAEISRLTGLNPRTVTRIAGPAR